MKPCNDIFVLSVKIKYILSASHPSRSLPLFPLSIVVFPGEITKLHIFEPRYKQLINDCFDTSTSFGIPTYIEGKDLSLGTEMTVSKIAHIHDNGNMDIICQAIGWFYIKEFYRITPNKLYPYGIIEEQPWDDESDFNLNLKIIELIEELYDLMNIKDVIIPQPNEFKSYHLAHKLGLSIHQEMALLELPNEVDKQVFIANHLNHLIPILRDAETMRKRAELNGHFQNLIPPF